MSEQTLAAELDLVSLFPDKVTADTRANYTGFMVSAGSLVEVARSLRDEYGFDMLSSVTAVDYFPEDILEFGLPFLPNYRGPRRCA